MPTPNARPLALLLAFFHARPGPRGHPAGRRRGPRGRSRQMAVCTDGKSHYVVIGPHERVTSQLYYGDSKNVSMVGPDPSGMLPGTDFQDPRFLNPGSNPEFAASIWRVYSAVDYDDTKKTCSLRCGERSQALSLVPPAEAKTLLSSMSFRKSLRTREPYALARDDHGIYYFIDRGATPETRASFPRLRRQEGRAQAAEDEGRRLGLRGRGLLDSHGRSAPHHPRSARPNPPG